VHVFLYLEELKEEPLDDLRLHAVFAHVEILLQVLVQELEHQGQLMHTP
jgi:hypothetical protein